MARLSSHGLATRVCFNLPFALCMISLAGFLTISARAQNSVSPQAAQIEGVVRDSAGNPVVGASVTLHDEGGSNSAATASNEQGAFIFSIVPAGTYVLTLKKAGYRDSSEPAIKLAVAEKKHFDFVLLSVEPSAPVLPFSASALELDDRPTFTLSGVTDSTGSGGHGSETRMRTGDVLAKETLNLSPTTKEAAKDERVSDAPGEAVLRALVLQNPNSFEANHRLGEFYLHSQRCREAIPLLESANQIKPDDHAGAFELVQAYEDCGQFEPARERVNRMLGAESQFGSNDEADLHRLLGELDEKLEDPLGAEREYERAASLAATEQNYFAWGAELLLHRATTPAVEVFGRGVRLHSDSARMLAGLGAAVYTSGSSEEAAQRLCEASDLDPQNSAPYLFLGKIQEASSAALPCAEEKLARFAHDHPQNALANYYYGLAIWKTDRASEDPGALKEAAALLEKSSAIDPRFDAAYLQLGNLRFASGDFQSAVSAYQKAVALNPLSSETHYRLSMAYQRIGEEHKAQSEVAQYKQLQKTEAAAIEKQRREVRQFLFVLKDQPETSPPR